MNIIFCGGSGEIGASCILLQLDGKNILLDCGIRMNTPDNLPDFRMIQENGGVDAVLISHAHMDHIGSLPIISREYPNASIYMTHATKDVTKVLLYDSLKIMNNRETEIPVYAESHVEEMLKKILCYSYEYTFAPFHDRDIQITFYLAGHIIGASAIYIQGKEGSLLYTGDFSATVQQTVNRINIPKLRPDVMIMESTYGDKLHSNRKIEEQRLIDITKQVIERGGKILIPAFAVGRAQEIILILKKAMNKKALPSFPIYIDGMVKDICRMYKLNPNYLKKDLAKKIWKGNEIFYTDEIQPVESFKLRDEIINSDKACCIISSSGMLTGGPSLYYAEQLIKDEKNYIAITGYQDEEAPGRHLLELLDSDPKDQKGRVLEIGERKLPIHCEFGKYGLSAHADKGELLGVIQKLAPRKLFLVHGNSDVLSNLAKEIHLLIRGQVYVPNNGEEYAIHFDNPRKQLKTLTIPSMQKGFWPGTKDIKILWDYLIEQARTLGYTLEELLYIWSGRTDFDETIIQDFQKLLNESLYFEPDERKLFLYNPISQERLEELTQPQFMEVNSMLAYAEQLFPPEAGLYKKGANFEEKIALLNFNFPITASKKYKNEIQQFEKETGWKVKINTECNLSAVNPLITQLLNDDGIQLLKISYYQSENKLKVHFSKKPENLDSLKEEFETITGIVLEIDYPEKKAAAPIEADSSIIEPDTNKKVLEQNAALALIEQVFALSQHKVYKKSIKTGPKGKYIELSFISPAIGNKYNDWIKDLASETGWPIRISPSVNQIEIIQIAVLLLQEYNLQPKKNPSIFQSEALVRVKLLTTPELEIWQKIQEIFLQKTGFTIEYTL